MNRPIFAVAVLVKVVTSFDLFLVRLPHILGLVHVAREILPIPPCVSKNCLP
jgi:hypothetical protein